MLLHGLQDGFALQFLHKHMNKYVFLSVFTIEWEWYKFNIIPNFSEQFKALNHWKCYELFAFFMAVA